MLVLARRPAQSIFLDFSGMTDAELLSLRSSAPIKVTVVEARGDKIRLGFDAPDPVQIHREEIFKPAGPAV
jgi:sRNA-binding carbon storage regulator CsrA